MDRSTPRILRALALALLVLPLAASASLAEGPADPALDAARGLVDESVDPGQFAPLPATPADPCGGIPGYPNPNAGCELPLSRGVNLAVWLQYWIPSSYTSSEDLATIRSLGFTFVRLPVNPELLMVGGDQGDGARPVDPAKITYVKRQIQLVLDADLGVVVDMHSYESYAHKIVLDERYMEEHSRVLTAVAKELATLPKDRVALGLLNEPSDPDDDPHTPFDYDPTQKKLWEAARAGDATLTLIATGNDWSSIEGLQATEVLPDPNVIYEFHFYTPFLFSHQGANWTWHIVRPIHDLPYPSTPQNVAAVRDSILDDITDERLRKDVGQFLTWYGNDRWDRARLADAIRVATLWGEENRVRLFLGEFGVFEEAAPDASRVEWTRDIREIAEAQNIPWAYWNWDSDFGIMDRDTREIHEGLVSALTD